MLFHPFPPLYNENSQILILGSFPSVKSSGLPAEEFSERLLQSKKVAVVPGSAFGDFGVDNVRISYATGMAALDEAFGKIAEFMQEIKK